MKWPFCENDLPQPDLQKCTITGRGLQLAETGQQTYFEVHLVDTAGDPYTTEQQVTAELRSNVDGSITSTSVAHKTPDTYEVSYQPNTRGQHVLNVTVNGEPVQGSPFLVYVRQAPHLLGKPVRVIRDLNYPFMIATTGSGELVVSEENKISFISRGGEKIRSIDTTSVGSGFRRYKLNPTGVAVDKDCNIYVTDEESYRLTAFIQGDLVQWVFMHVDPLSSFRVTSHSPVSLQQSDRPILLLRRLTADIYCSRQWRVSGTWQTHDLCIKSGTIPLYDSVYWSRQILCILILLFKLTQLLLRLTIWMKSSILCLYACIHTSELHWSPHSAVTQLPPAVVPQSLAPQPLLLVCLNILSESIGWYVCR